MEQAEEILSSVRQGIPATSQYRINIERIYNFRLKCAKESSDIREFEVAARAGQIEELLQQVGEKYFLD